MRRALLLAGVAVVVCAAAAAAYVSLQPRLAPPAGNQNCAPKPCAAPNGLEISITSVLELESLPGTVDVHVRLANNTQPRAFEAVSYRHTSPQDFSGLAADGSALRPDLSACRDWGEVRVARGASAGPFSVCFRSPISTLRWAPDLGPLFDHVDIPLR